MHPLEELTARIRAQSKILDGFDSMKQRDRWTVERDRLFGLRGQLQQMLRNQTTWTVRATEIEKILRLVVYQNLAINGAHLSKLLLVPGGSFPATVARAILPINSLPPSNITQEFEYPSVAEALKEYDRIILGVPGSIEVAVNISADPLDLYRDEAPPERSRYALTIQEVVKAGLDASWDGWVRDTSDFVSQPLVDVEAPPSSPIWAALRRRYGSKP